MTHEYFMTTERLGFSKWLETDLPLARSLWGDKEVTKYISLNGYTDEMIIKRFNAEREIQEKFGVQYWPIFTLKDNKFIGVAGLKPYDFEPGDLVDGVYMLGYHLMKDAWGNGYATEASKCVVKYAIETLKAVNVVAGHNPNNSASGKVLLKCGFIKKYDLFFPPTGLNHPLYYFIDDDRKLFNLKNIPKI
ncbi:N-acetyltransferase GCN5 [Tritrichomonas foetus]|uniref:N-acetyltransferase GCN5 n=1 Tax=Tritrichomonas foetus TaxID=1144522 RepID=A0A1J4KY32_9EUKA|nr:N-acetyltransferase GCN5 [Tritrichomonas foetus]|eukprot:OHT14622.1 N-acetyltransferase GCN5 [Tritrichomonas foetus]